MAAEGGPDRKWSRWMHLTILLVLSLVGAALIWVIRGETGGALLGFALVMAVGLVVEVFKQARRRRPDRL